MGVMLGDFNDPNWESRQHCMNCSKVVGPRRFGTASSPLLCFRRLVRFMMVFKDQREMELSHIYIYIYMYTVCMYIYIYNYILYNNYMYIYIYKWIQSCKSLVTFNGKTNGHRGYSSLEKRPGI